MVIAEGSPRTIDDVSVVSKREQPAWLVRKEPQQKLLSRFGNITIPGFDPDSMLFYTSSVTYGTSVDRSIFFNAQVPYQLTDALRGVKIFDYNKEEEAKKMDLEVELTPFSAKISNPAENSSILLHMNAPDSLFTVYLKPYDPKIPFKNQELADAAKDILKQSKGKYVMFEGTPEQREGESFRREFDKYDENWVKTVEPFNIYDPDNVAFDEYVASSILSVLGTMSESASLNYISSSDNAFRNRYPNYRSSDHV